MACAYCKWGEIYGYCNTCSLPCCWRHIWCSYHREMHCYQCCNRLDTMDNVSVQKTYVGLERSRKPTDAELGADLLTPSKGCPTPFAQPHEVAVLAREGVALLQGISLASTFALSTVWIVTKKTSETIEFVGDQAQEFTYNVRVATEDLYRHVLDTFNIAISVLGAVSGMAVFVRVARWAFANARPSTSGERGSQGKTPSKMCRQPFAQAATEEVQQPAGGGIASDIDQLQLAVPSLGARPSSLSQQFTWRHYLSSLNPARRSANLQSAPVRKGGGSAGPHSEPGTAAAPSRSPFGSSWRSVISNLTSRSAASTRATEEGVAVTQPSQYSQAPVIEHLQGIAIKQTLVKAGGLATRSMLVGCFTIDFRPLALALITLAEAGGDVRVLADHGMMYDGSGTSQGEVVNAMLAGGVNVRTYKPTSSRNSACHFKLVVFDQSATLQGSANFSHNSLDGNCVESCVFTRSQQVVESTLALFEDLWKKGNPVKPADLKPMPSRIVDLACKKMTENYSGFHVDIRWGHGHLMMRQDQLPSAVNWSLPGVMVPTTPLLNDERNVKDLLEAQGIRFRSVLSDFPRRHLALYHKKSGSGIGVSLRVYVVKAEDVMLELPLMTASDGLLVSGGKDPQDSKKFRYCTTEAAQAMQTQVWVLPYLNNRVPDHPQNRTWMSKSAGSGSADPHSASGTAGSSAASSTGMSVRSIVNRVGPWGSWRKGHFEENAV